MFEQAVRAEKRKTSLRCATSTTPHRTTLLSNQIAKKVCQLKCETCTRSTWLESWDRIGCGPGHPPLPAQSHEVEVNFVKYVTTCYSVPWKAHIKNRRIPGVSPGVYLALRNTKVRGGGIPSGIAGKSCQRGSWKSEVDRAVRGPPFIAQERVLGTRSCALLRHRNLPVWRLYMGQWIGATVQAWRARCSPDNRRRTQARRLC